VNLILPNFPENTRNTSRADGLKMLLFLTSDLRSLVSSPSSYWLFWLRTH